MPDELKIGQTVLRLQPGDIVEAGTEAIVNAANRDLEPGGGICGAIYEAAGFEVLDDLTRPLGGCPEGQAKITAARLIPLPTRYIIHAVSPIYEAGQDRQSFDLLGQAYRASLALADEHDLSSIAFPSLGTGVHRYQIERTAPFVLRTVTDYLNEREAAGQPSRLTLILFVLYSYWDLEAYRQAFERQASPLR